VRIHVAVNNCLLVGALASGSILTRTASGCTCLETSAREQFDAADAVFRCQVVSVQPAEAFWRKVLREAELQWWSLLGRHHRYDDALKAWVNGPYYGNLVRLQVHRSWKGIPDGSGVTVRTDPHPAACGVIFREGMTYLVYAYRGSDGFETNRCVRTVEIQWAIEDTRQLNQLLSSPAPMK
jgi:hypothetical protein